MISFQRDHFVNTEDLVFPFIDDISGTIRGYRIFTACRTVNGKIFRLEDHLDRLYNSASSIYMIPPKPRQDLKKVLMEVIERNVGQSPENLLIDIIFSGGLEGETMRQSGAVAHLYVVVQRMVSPPREYYVEGVTLATFAHQRMLPDVKLLNYIGAVIAHQTVVPEYQAYDTLFLCPFDNKTILEGSTFTIFFVTKGGEIVTPPLDGRILDSVTRRAIFEIIRPVSGIKLSERTVSIDDLGEFEEAFLASTTRNILPVVRLNDKVIGSGRPGPLTLEMMDLLNNYVNSY
ncbi:MAG: aminotransferase class IV [Pseudomonadota bacterium]